MALPNTNELQVKRVKEMNYVYSNQSYITLQLDFFTLSVCVPASQAEHWLLSPASLYLQSSHSNGLVPPFSFLISPSAFSTFSSLGWFLPNLDLSSDILNSINNYIQGEPGSWRIEDDLKAIHCIWCCYKADSFTIYLLIH